MKTALKLTVTLSLLSTLGACSLMPEYEQPAPLVDVSQVQSEQGLTVAELGWREFYLDPTLQNLIATALENNQNFRVSSLTVEQLQRQYRIQRAAMLPTVNAEGSYTRERIPATSSQFQFGQQDYINEQYRVGLGLAAWELDFFGRLDSLSESALQQFFASQSARDSAQLTLIANVADSWFSWQAAYAQYELAKDTRVFRQDSFKLIEKRFNSGLGSELDVRQAETAVHEARILEAQYQQQANQAFTTLQMLTGTTLDKSALQTQWEGIKTLRDIPANLTSEVLLQRPDVKEAEHQIQAANASIGAARAAFFPRISLTAGVGLTGMSASQLSESGSRYWQIAPQFTLPLLDWGVNDANLDVAELQKDINIANYQSIIQQAFKEVRDEMEARYTLDDQLNAQNDLSQATARTLELAKHRFDVGVDSYLDVLDAQRSLIASRLSQIDIRLQRLRNQLTLYKALGGGLYADTK